MISDFGFEPFDFALGKISDLTTEVSEGRHGGH
jgi:hypothetical protein